MRSPLSVKRNLPHMTWDPKNLYLLWQHSFGNTVSFTASRLTLFQQRWKSKALVRAYHGDFIKEKIFKRWYLPSMLPDVRPRSKAFFGNDTAALEAFAQRTEQLEKERKRKLEIEQKGMAPVGSLMFIEVERRIDVFLFRCCFAHSVYEARRLVIHGDVMLNGEKHQNANTRLAPGDMVSVNPSAIRFLRGKPSFPSELIPGGGPAKPTKKYANKKVKLEGEQTGEQEAEKNVECSEPKAECSEQDAGLGGSERDVESGIKQVGGWDNEHDGEQNGALEDPLTPFHLPPYASPHIFIPAYIEPSFSTCSAIYVRHPTARPGYSEIPTPFDADGEVVRLAWEWYAKRRPRIRSKAQLARMPENRTTVSEARQYMRLPTRK